MEDIVEEARSNGKQVVIFSNWTQMTDVIYERLHHKYTLSLITGDTKDEVRQANVEQFQNGNSKIIIGTIGAMGTGLTLTAGTVVIFMDHPWNRALYDQAVDRCHRIGQESSITIYNLMCKDTIDERIWSIVKTKGAISDTVIDGKNTIDMLLGI
jgi:SNF2 family DNA or RNA helicase